jgi:hypothetical protein
MGSCAGNTIDSIDFRGIRPTHIGNDLILSLGMADPNGLGNLREQVDDWGATQQEGRGAHRLLEAGQAVEKNAHVHTLPKARLDSAVEFAQIHEEKLIGKAEVFVQEPITEERTWRVRQESLMTTETYGMQALGRAYNQLGPTWPLNGAKLYLARIVQEELIERIRELTLTMQEEAQVVELEIRKARAPKTTQSEPEHRHGL